MSTIHVSRFDGENFARPCTDVLADELAWLCSDPEDEDAEAEAYQHDPIYGDAAEWPPGPWDHWSWWPDASPEDTLPYFTPAVPTGPDPDPDPDLA